MCHSELASRRRRGTVPRMQDSLPDAIAELAQRAKQQLRRRLRGVRQALPASALRARSERLVERLMSLDAVQSARSVGSFWPMAGRNEVDLREFHLWARARGQRTYYPFMEPLEGAAGATGESGHRTGFREVADSALLVPRGQGFAEPPRDQPAALRGELDLIVVPALGVALNGHRLGYGAGFYDATLPDFSPPARTVVVAFEFQLLAELPQREGDFPCDLIVTDERSLEAER